MTYTRWTCCVALVLAAMSLSVLPAHAQDQAGPIAQSKITALHTQLEESVQAASSARKKLALGRVIREANTLIEQAPAAPNRYEVLSVLFRGQQELVRLDGSPTNRSALLETCRQLAGAPNSYASIRLDADLLLSQAELARQGADAQTRADALRPLVKRYRDTDVEAKVIRIAMLMALEFGDAGLIDHLRGVIAERFADDLEMINFQREKLAGQVFGAPFVAALERADGQAVRFPMDTLGTTTAVLFWSKDNRGEEHVKELATAWHAKKGEARGRLAIVSINLDDLPDAGQSTLREHGLDWPALRLPGGRDHPIYQAYARRDPAIITVSPTGYAALFMAGGNSDTNGYERWLNSSLAREWTRSHYTSQLQSLLAGEFLILDPQRGFEPAAPPELKALAPADAQDRATLARTAQSVPEDKLRAIQACFIAPPRRYSATIDEVQANYEKADALCQEAIAAHPSAPDLWVVRNRRIVALMGLWKIQSDNAYFERAAREARAALDAGYPEGADVVARLCLARQALRAQDADTKAIIGAFADPSDSQPSQGPALAAAALLSLDMGDRRLHEHYRRAVLDHHGDHPMMWTAAAYMLDRYHRYWMYHPPFTAGWTYGRRQGHFLAIGTPEDAQRTLRTELKTLDGETLRIPQDTAGKWTVLSFVPNAQGNGFLQRYGTFTQARPFNDVALIAVVLDDDAQAARETIQAKKTPDGFPTLLLPGGMDNPIVKQLGILEQETRPNLVILRPDGSIAVALSGLTMSAQNGNAMQNVLEWHDEKAVDEALARGDLAEAKRLAFAYAPPEVPATAEGKKPAKPAPIAIPHLRSRAKVYMAMQDWQAAFEDAERAYLAVNSRAGWISMRTDELDEIEALKATILSKLKQSDSTP